MDVTLTRFKNHPELETMAVQSIIRDLENNLWISTKDSGTMQISFSDDFDRIKSIRIYNTYSGLTTDNIKAFIRIRREISGSGPMGRHFNAHILCFRILYAGRELTQEQYSLCDQLW